VLRFCSQENGRLEEELSAVKLRLAEEESSVVRLRADLNQLLHDKVTPVSSFSQSALYPD